MDEQTAKSTEPTKRFRPRFSLLTVLLVMALVACAITIWRLWREVAPLRVENLQLRAELGKLTIEDPQLAYAMRLPSLEDDTWKWRIYLPPGRQYTLYEYQGMLPDRSGNTGPSWYDDVRKVATGSITTGENMEGEFSFEARLIKENDDLMLATSFRRYDGDKTSAVTGKSSVDKEWGEWLSDYRSKSESSDVLLDAKSFEPGKPILLLHLGRVEVSRSPDGRQWRRVPQKGPAEGIVLWIE